MASDLFSLAFGKKRKLSPQWKPAFLLIGYCRVMRDKDDRTLYCDKWMLMRRLWTRRNGDGIRIWYVPTKEDRKGRKAKQQERAKILYL